MTEKEIVAFIHCKKCLSELREGEKYSQKIAVGLTSSRRLQVWCKIHNEQVAAFEVVLKRKPRCGEEIQ